MSEFGTIIDRVKRNPVISGAVGASALTLGLAIGAMSMHARSAVAETAPVAQEQIAEMPSDVSIPSSAEMPIQSGDRCAAVDKEGWLAHVAFTGYGDMYDEVQRDDCRRKEMLDRYLSNPNRLESMSKLMTGLALSLRNQYDRIPDDLSDPTTLTSKDVFSSGLRASNGKTYTVRANVQYTASGLENAANLLPEDLLNVSVTIYNDEGKAESAVVIRRNVLTGEIFILPYDSFAAGMAPSVSIMPQPSSSTAFEGGGKGAVPDTLPDTMSISEIPSGPVEMSGDFPSASSANTGDTMMPPQTSMPVFMPASSATDQLARDEAAADAVKNCIKILGML